VVRVKRGNHWVKAPFSLGKGRIRHGESRAGFGFQISIMVGLLHYCKVEEFSVVLAGNSDRNSMRLSASIITFQTTPFPNFYVLVLCP